MTFEPVVQLACLSVSKSDSHTGVAVIVFLIETLLCHDIRRILLPLQITSDLTIDNSIE